MLLNTKASADQVNCECAAYGLWLHIVNTFSKQAFQPNDGDQMPAQKGEK